MKTKKLATLAIVAVLAMPLSANATMCKEGDIVFESKTITCEHPHNLKDLLKIVIQWYYEKFGYS